MIRVYTCNLRVFWALFLVLVTVVVVLHHRTQTVSLQPTADISTDPQRAKGCCEFGLGLGHFIAVLASVLCFLCLRCFCSTHPRKAGKDSRPTATSLRPDTSRRELLEDYYERWVRLSPHMVGHSKANVSKVIGDLIRSGRTATPHESCLTLRGDFLQVGSTYEEHKVGSPDCFDVLVPLRPPNKLKLRPRVLWGAEGRQAAEKGRQREEDAGEVQTKGEIKRSRSVKSVTNDKKNKRTRSGHDVRENDHEKKVPKRGFEDVFSVEGDILRPLNTKEGESGPVPKGCLEVPLHEEWVRRHPAFANNFLRPCRQDSPPAGGEGGTKVYIVSPALVLRWFFLTMQRCLAAVSYSHQQHCKLSITLSDQCVQLHLIQQPDYICCHISTVVHMVPVFLFGNNVYLAPPKTAPLLTKQSSQGEVWTLYFPHHEQKLLSLKRTQFPPSSCHLKCLQLVKAIRDLGGQALDRKGAAAWGTVLSSYVLKTAWMRLLLRIPVEAWEDRHLVGRVEDLIQCLTEALGKRCLAPVFVGGQGAHSLASFSKQTKETVGVGNLWAGILPEHLERVSGRLAHTWTHLHRLVRLTRPQRSSANLGAPGLGFQLPKHHHDI